MGFRLVIDRTADSGENPLNPCSGMPARIRREQFISICAGIWRRHLSTMAKKEKSGLEGISDDNA